MKLTKAAPPVPRLRQEFDRLFERFFEPPIGRFEMPLMETEWAPALDYSETEKEFVIRLEAPGVHKENLDVTLEQNVLTISGKRELRKEEEGEEFIWKERDEGRFVRSLRLPKPIDPENVTAVYQDGILTLRLPKAEPAMKNRITIR
ncbi:MAG: Hsp20/alpha crystallin family protein [Actinobacteria bacterium]|nr:Hsp20/alpha crystallin family protein [Actinomycetota bacterium]